MMNFLRRLFSILRLNSLIATTLAVGSTCFCVARGWKLDFPLTTIGVAVVFPIVFSIGGAYSRREAALGHYGVMKSMGRCIFLATRDWLRDEGEARTKNVEGVKTQVFNVFSHCLALFQNRDDVKFSAEELLVYQEFGHISGSIEALRDRGLSGSEVSRVHSYLSKFVTAFEGIKHIHQYRTPRTLRLYAGIFVYAMSLALGPYFALLAAGQALWVGLMAPALFALVFTGLYNIQEDLENPFDQVGEDDITINPEKFVLTLENRRN